MSLLMWLYAKSAQFRKFFDAINRNDVLALCVMILAIISLMF